MDDFGREKRIYKELPSDEDIACLSYDPAILEIAVWDRVAFNRPTYLNPDAFTDYNQDWQIQCSIWEHIMRYSGFLND